MQDTLGSRSLERNPTPVNTQIPQDLQVRHANSTPAESREGREHCELSGKASYVTFRQMAKRGDSILGRKSNFTKGTEVGTQLLSF